MSKLGTHDVRSEKVSGEQGPQRRKGDVACVACGESAIGRCERCGARICREHARKLERMCWEKLRSNAPYAVYGRETWQHYVPNGSWRLCPDCARTVADLNAKELARDRRETLWRRIGYSILLGLTLLVMLAITALEVSQAGKRGACAGSTPHPAVYCPQRP